jgi:hypothetical protein
MHVCCRALNAIGEDKSHIYSSSPPSLMRALTQAGSKPNTGSSRVEPHIGLPTFYEPHLTRIAAFYPTRYAPTSLPLPPYRTLTPNAKLNPISSPSAPSTACPFAYRTFGNQSCSSGHHWPINPRNPRADDTLVRFRWSTPNI